ncbi:MAG: PBSX family phage terminase large subunit [Xanthobacteraceae bacterium]
MTDAASSVRIPEAFEPLLESHRYKIFWGGRGSAKSWTFATVLIAKAAERPLRILCTRESMNSIRESVHELLAQRIESLGLLSQFEVGDTFIRHVNGSEFIHAGLRQNVAKVRSLEGVDICWCEEAATILRSSWEVLIPTIRKDGSEIWISFNPELETDATYTRFVMKPPANAVVRHVTWKDNPWFPDVLRREMEDLKARDPDAYAHVYGGTCRYVLDGAIYAKEVRLCQEEGRIGQILYDPTKPVSIYVDLGWADTTAMWLVQHIAGEMRFIDYLEDSQLPFNEYLHTLQQKPYLYQTLWLPHDAKAKSLGTGRSIEEIARSAGWRVRIVPRLSVADGINAARTLFPVMYFDRQKCADGLQHLRRYRYDVNDNGSFTQRPLHDEASHAADALRYCAVAMQEAKRAVYHEPALPRPVDPRERHLGWLGR